MIFEFASRSMQDNAYAVLGHTHADGDILDTHGIPISAHKYYAASGIKTCQKTVDRLTQQQFIIDGSIAVWNTFKIFINSAFHLRPSLLGALIPISVNGDVSGNTGKKSL